MSNKSYFDQINESLPNYSNMSGAVTPFSTKGFLTSAFANNPVTAYSSPNSNVLTLKDPVTGALSSTSPEWLNSNNVNYSTFDAGNLLGNSSNSGFFSDIFSDKYKMGNITGLASTLMQAAALPSMLKNARLQNQSLQFNLDTARKEQANREAAMAGFDTHGSASKNKVV